MSQRSMGMGPSVVLGQQRAHRVEQVDVASRTQLDQRDSRRRVRDEDVQQAVGRARTGEEVLALAGDVLDGLSAPGGHTDHFGSHRPCLPARAAVRARTGQDRSAQITTVVSPPDGGYPLCTGSPHGAPARPGAAALRLPGGRDALMVMTYDDGLDNERSSPAPG